MTIATTATTEFNVDELVTLALQSIGFLNPMQPAKAGDLQLGRQLLFLGIQALTNDGIVVRSRELLTMSLTAGVAYADAPADTITIEKGGVIRDAAGIDVPIELVSMARYQSFPDKTVTGTPSFYWAEQQSSGVWRVKFFPVPSAESPTFIVPRTRRPRDVSQGSVTVDFDPKWHLTLVTFLSARLARSKGRRDLATELTQEYMMERERALNNETERGDGEMCMSPTPWDDF